MESDNVDIKNIMGRAYMFGGMPSSFGASEEELKALNFNRFLGKVEQDHGTQSTQSMSYMIFNQQGRNFFQSDNFDVKDARQVVTGTVITSCFIQTSALPNRVELSGNDARFYDDSTGGTGSIAGDSASIKFIRADKNPGDFVIQKRHGVNNDLENVFEMYYSAAAGGSQKNYIFIGRVGDSTLGSYSDETVLHGVWAVRAEVNRVFQYASRPTIYTADYNKIDNTKLGVVTTIAGEGRDGFVGMGKLVEILTFAGATAFAVGDTITGNATGATAKLIYKISTTIFYADHTNTIAFNPATDNACTTNGAGGGSGTGDLSANQFGNAVIILVDPLLNIIVGNHILPDTTGVYNIGSAALKFGNIYGAIVACPLPTVLDALEVIRKIPDPTEVGERGHFGDGLYFDDKTFPDEVLHDTPDGRDIEHTRMIGLLMQGMRQLLGEVDTLKEKLRENGIY